MFRKITVSLIGIIIILSGIFIYRYLSEQGEKKKIRTHNSYIQKVFVQKIKNADIPLKIVSSGQLVAADKTQLRTEVTGVLRSSKFDEGVRYRKGEVILHIDNQENKANVVSQRSHFYTSLLKIMPDITLDYPDVAEKWDNYLKSINTEKNLPDLPHFTNEQEKNLIIANGIITAYHRTKNMEIRQEKFYLTAPFSGVITEAFVESGDLVNAGQSVGEISSVGTYELELLLNVSFLTHLKIGQKVKLHNLSREKTWIGVVLRINPKVSTNTQSAKVFIGVDDKSLTEGMYLQAMVDAGVVENAFEIDRKLINVKNQVFFVKDSMLDVINVSPVFYYEETAIVRGLPDNIYILSKVLPKAYVGMKVEIMNKNNRLKQ